MKLSARAAVALLCWNVSSACAGEWETLQLKRAEVFEFTEEPKASRHGDEVTITFATKEYCDATVAIENTDGKIVRHLASGLLGAHAPAPFKPDALKQELHWDGKDELGKYLDDWNSLSVRVSLGLKARYERTLHWSPKQRTGEGGEKKIVAAPEGLYVWDKDSLRLCDRAGEYVRTLYPFPSTGLDRVRGVVKKSFPPGGEFPLKWGTSQETLLTLSHGGGEKGWPGKGGGATATCMDVRDGQVALVHQRVNCFSPEGADLTGSKVAIYPVMLGTVHDFPGGEYFFPPQSAALSPDSKWLYLTGYIWSNPWQQGSQNGLVRVALDGKSAPEVFLGNMEKEKPGIGEREFNVPSSVACDAQGRLYVTDFLNDRVQVFAPEGKFVQSIKLERPALIRVHPKTGELYVFSWSMQFTYDPRWAIKGKPTLTHLSALGEAKVLGTYGFALPDGFGSLPCAEVDFWATPLTVWLAPVKPMPTGDWWRQANLQQWVLQDGKLQLKRTFSEEAEKELVRSRPPRHDRQRLYFNPGDGMLYAGDHFNPAVIHAKGFPDLLRLNPQSGEAKVVGLPFDAEDMCFDINGLAYLRTVDRIARFDSRTWREVPFDYGEECEQTTNQGFRTARTISTLFAAGGENSSLQYGGMAVSPLGHLLVHFYIPSQPKDRRTEKSLAGGAVKKYEPKIFPGRSIECILHVWDKHGKLVCEDAMPGFRRSASVGIDREDHLYLMTDGLLSSGGQAYPDPSSCTLLKVKAGAAKVLTQGQVPVPLAPEAAPKRPPDLTGCLGPDAWVENALWMRGGVGQDSKRQHCHCTGTSQLALDYFGRVFVPELARYGVVLFDTNGNALLRLGRYGNVDEGQPLVKEGSSTDSTGSPQASSGQAGPKETKALGGDELTLFNPRYLATDTDRRLFIADPGNRRILSVRLEYHASAKVALGTIPNGK